MRVSIAQPFKVAEVRCESGTFGEKEDYEVLAIGVIDPATEELSTDFKQRTRLLVADDGGHLVWVKPEECRVMLPQGVS